MPSAAPPLKGRKSPLYDWHVSRNARMGLVEGVQLPILYRAFELEYRDLRSSAALFDLHSFSLLRVSSPDARKTLNHFFTIDTLEPREGRVTDTLMCDQEGHVIDRVRIFFQETHLLLLCSPGRAELVAAALSEVAIAEGLTIESISDTSTVLGVVGPRCDAIIAAALKSPSFALEYNETAVTSIYTAKVILARIAMCGEPAYIIITGSSYAPIVVERLLECGVPFSPCGTAAWEAARIEGGVPRMAAEAAEPIMPIDLDMLTLVDRNKLRFNGRDALIIALQSAQGRWLVTVQMKDKVIPRAGAAIMTRDDNPIGKLTSGVFSPRLRNGLGLGLVDRQSAIVGNEIAVKMYGRNWAAEIGPRPLYVNPILRSNRI
jgi:aminomethyltransferase